MSQELLYHRSEEDPIKILALAWWAWPGRSSLLAFASTNAYKIPFFVEMIDWTVIVMDNCLMTGIYVFESNFVGIASSTKAR